MTPAPFESRGGDRRADGPRRKVLAALVAQCALVACGGGDYGVPGAPITGTVFDQAGMPVPQATIFVWVWFANGSGSGFTGFTAGPATTDSLGRYSISGLPVSATVTLQITAEGYRQPCVTQQPIVGGSVVNGLIHSEAYLLGGGGPPADAGSVVSGRVTSAASGAPIPATSVWVDPLGGLGIGGAETLTDASGHYWTCRIPTKPGVLFEYSASGYAGHEVGVDVSASRIVDVALTPR